MDIDAIKNRIDNIMNQTIEKGIIIELRGTVENITYTKEDKYSLLHPYHYLDDVIFKNHNLDYCLPLFLYNKLVDELNKFEHFNIVYSKALFEFFKSNGNLNDSIYYGYMNDFIRNKMLEIIQKENYNEE